MFPQGTGSWKLDCICMIARSYPIGRVACVLISSAMCLQRTSRSDCWTPDSARVFWNTPAISTESIRRQNQSTFRRPPSESWLSMTSFLIGVTAYVKFRTSVATTVQFLASCLLGKWRSTLLTAAFTSRRLREEWITSSDVYFELFRGTAIDGQTFSV